jgi:MFS transporter, DHA2 family, methylenomycin A resistance protein
MGRQRVHAGVRQFAAVGQALAALGYVSLVFVRVESSALAVALPTLTVGVGAALAVPSIITAVLTHVDSTRMGVASGVLNTARQIGGVLGVGLFGALVRPESNDLVGGLHLAVILAALVTLASLLGVLLGLRASGSLVADSAR